MDTNNLLLMLSSIITKQEGMSVRGILRKVAKVQPLSKKAALHRNTILTNLLNNSGKFVELGTPSHPEWFSTTFIEDKQMKTERIKAKRIQSKREDHPKTTYHKDPGRASYTTTFHLNEPTQHEYWEEQY